MKKKYFYMGLGPNVENNNDKKMGNNVKKPPGAPQG